MYYINDKEYKCSVAVTLDIFNDRWKLAIIWHLLDGDKRFKDLHEIIRIKTAQITITIQETTIGIIICVERVNFGICKIIIAGREI